VTGQVRSIFGLRPSQAKRRTEVGVDYSIPVQYGFKKGSGCNQALFTIVQSVKGTSRGMGVRFIVHPLMSEEHLIVFCEN